jgi:hypothetical protein
VTEATSTSPSAALAGRWIVSLDPKLVTVTTSVADGDALRAGPDPVTVTPSTSPRTTKWI